MIIRKKWDNTQFSPYCRRILGDRFTTPLNYPEQNYADSSTLLTDMSSEEIRIDIAEENIRDVLREAKNIDFKNIEEDNRGIFLEILSYGCELGKLYKGDIDIWTRRMVRGAGEEIRPWLGGIWRLKEHGVYVWPILKTAFDNIFALRSINPKTTAGQVYKYMEEKLTNKKDLSQYKYYINAIYAAIEEYENPGFIEKVLNKRDNLCPKCNLSYSMDKENCSYCGSKLELANRYVCLSCDKFVSDEFTYCPYCGTKIDRNPDLKDDVDMLSFSILKFTYGHDAEPSDVVSIYVNGHSFKEIIRHHEWYSALKTGQQDSVGDYAWLTVGEIIENLEEIHDPNAEDDPETLILGCSCGYAEDRPFYVTVTEKDNQIIWSDFRNPYKLNPESSSYCDYSGVGEYRFDKEQYYSEIEKLKRWRVVQNRWENNKNPMFIPDFWEVACRLGCHYIARGVNDLPAWAGTMYKAAKGKNAEKIKYWLPAFWQVVQNLINKGKQIDFDKMKMAFESIGTIQKLEFEISLDRFAHYKFMQKWSKHVDDENIVKEYEPYVKAAFEGMMEYTRPTHVTFTINDEIDKLEKDRYFEDLLSKSLEETDGNTDSDDNK